jgi:hypothetical protein
MFKEQFFGKSLRAEDCKILNPDVLVFNYDEGQKKLSAYSTDFLIIENDALGYKIKYLLQDFVYIASPDSNLLRFKGVTFFGQLKGSPAQQKRWEKERQDVYGNSALHFYRALLSSDLKGNGFNVQEYAHYNNPDRPSDSVITLKLSYFKKNKLSDSIKRWRKIGEMPKMRRELMPYSLTAEEIANRTSQPGIYALGCEDNGLFVTYDKNGHFPNFKLDHINSPTNIQSTLITFNQLFVFFDSNGMLLDPYSVSYQGVWPTQREADLLPIDYDENSSTTPTVAVDSTVADKAVDSLQSYLADHPVEKAYLHFDKPYYAAGDTMYFKAYLTEGGKHELSRLSGVLHVDLINNNKIKQSLNLGIYDGVAWGDFILPDSIHAGTFRVRAYTQWMRNEGEHRYFDKIIPVAVASAKDAAVSNAVQSPATGKPDIQFLPEGGTLVEGVKSKIAFKAINTNGLGIEVKGEVIDNDNKTVCSFSSAHLGMGYFYLDPAPGKPYKARVTYGNGTQDVVNLPVADNADITLAVTNDSAQTIPIAINTNTAYLKANRGKDYTLIIYSGGKVSDFIFPLDSVVTSIDIPKNELFTGIAKITLFSPKSDPLAERLIFVQNYDQLKVTLKSDNAVYAPRGKINLGVTTFNDGGAPTIGEFSVSVTNESKEPVDLPNESTILNNLLLTSDLKGLVEQPNYYFISSSEGLKNLDNLMLTQGYSGFEWKEILRGKMPPVIYQPETTLSLSGNVKSLTGKPLAGGSVTLSSVNPFVVKDTTTDAKGNFTFTGLNYIDTAKLLLSALKKNNSSYVKIELNKPDYPAVTPANNLDSTANVITPEMIVAMQKQYKQRQGNMRTGIMLKEIDIKDRSKSPFDTKLTHSNNLNGAGNADQVILGSKLVGCTNIALCLQSMLFGVRFSGDASNPTIYSLRTPIELTGTTKPMVIILDGVISQQSVLSSLSAADIYSIEVLLKPYLLNVYGTAASGGAIVITTKRGGDANYTPSSSSNSIHYDFNGFYRARKFYSPKYEATAPAGRPDTRTTIFWEPQLITDKDGKASLEFYNSDEPGNYRVVIEGIDAAGDLGRAVYHYTVK